jgi:hypothetical protein
MTFVRLGDRKVLRFLCKKSVYCTRFVVFFFAFREVTNDSFNVIIKLEPAVNTIFSVFSMTIVIATRNSYHPFQTV